MTFSEIWYVDPFQQNKNQQKKISILAFFGLFVGQKTAKIDQNEENWQNQNCLIKFSEIWYVNASQKKMLQKLLSDFGNFWPFLANKQPKLTKNEENWQNLNRSMKFTEIW